jgi:integrase
VYTGKIAFNPARHGHFGNVRRTLPSVRSMAQSEEERYPLTVDEVEAIIAALPQPWDMYTGLAAATGMRPSEIAALTLADVGLGNGEVHGRRVLVDVGGRLVAEDQPKTAKSRRTIALDTTTIELLSAYIAAHRQRAMAWFSEHPKFTNPGDALPLFVGMGVGRANGKPDVARLDFSKPMRYGLFYHRYWRATLTSLGLPEHIRFYDLRHAHASLVVDRIGQPGALTLKEVQERLGHASAVLTLDRYAHTGKRDNAKQRHALDSVLGRQSNVVPIKRNA